MRKTLAILIMVFLLCGCSSEKLPTEDAKNPTQACKELVSQSEDKNNERKIDAEIRETVIFENGGIRLTVRGIEYTSYGVSIKLLVENDSEKNITIAGNTFQINDVITIGGNLHISVAAGKKANGEIEFFNEGLKNYEIEEIMSVKSGDSWVYDSDSFETIFNLDFEIQTSLYGIEHQEVDTSGNILFDENGFQIIEKEIRQEEHTIYLMIHNGSESDIIVQPRNVSVNDYMVNTMFSDFIASGTYRLLLIEIYEDDLKENEIDKIESAIFTLNIIDPSSYEDIAIAKNLTVPVGDEGYSYEKEPDEPTLQEIFPTDESVWQETIPGQTETVEETDPVIISTEAKEETKVAEVPIGPEEALVWIPTSGGKKYHRRSGCSNMDDPKQVPLSQAKARGFSACKRCY